MKWTGAVKAKQRRRVSSGTFFFVTWLILDQCSMPPITERYLRFPYNSRKAILYSVASFFISSRPEIVTGSVWRNTGLRCFLGKPREAAIRRQAALCRPDESSQDHWQSSAEMQLLPVPALQLQQQAQVGLQPLGCSTVCLGGYIRRAPQLILQQARPQLRRESKHYALGFRGQLDGFGTSSKIAHPFTARIEP